MEKLSFVKNGVFRLPPGFRFHPTDEELVLQYLKRKVFCLPLPASVIGEMNICKYDPWNLPGNWEEERYFFSNWEAKYCNGNRTNRATDSGYWKATGFDKQIVEMKRNQIVGMKKTLVFYRGKSSHASKTDWIMHEYRLVSIDASQRKCPKSKSNKNSVPMGNWVLCRIFMKKRGRKNDDATNRAYYDLTMAPSASDVSGITEISANERPDDQDESSSCNSLSDFRREQ